MVVENTKKKSKKTSILISLIDPGRSKTLSLRTWKEKEKLEGNKYTLLLMKQSQFRTRKNTIWRRKPRQAAMKND